MRRGLHPRCVAETTHAVESAPLEWRRALAVLNVCLGAETWQGANARVVVSNLWVRYGVVPWSDTLTSEQERLAHARIRLAETYGNTGQDWRVALSDAAPGEARVASAIPEALLSELRSMLDAHRVRMLSVQPRLIAAYNRCRTALPERSGWFVNIEPGALSAACLGPRGWDRVYSARIGTDWATELRRLRTFARLASRDESDRIFVDAPARMRQLAEPCESDIEWLHVTDETGTPVGSTTSQPLRLHT
jgi:hypothetical protein